MNAEQKPYAGNPHVRFDEGLLARTSCTASWGLLNRLNQTLSVGRPSQFTLFTQFTRKGFGTRDGFGRLPQSTGGGPT
jgi:hypothetical protein